MPEQADDLSLLLNLEQIEENIFRGRCPDLGWQRVFGGLVIAQALVAAMRTVVGRAAHSLHGYFMLAGDPRSPIVYEVDRIRDGASFTTRRCVAIQSGRAIFLLSASFQVEETGFQHWAPMPHAPGPEGLETLEEIAAHHADLIAPDVRRYFERERPFEIRPTDSSRYMPGETGPRPASQAIWIRCRRTLPDDDWIHRAALAYVSDMTLLDTALVAHGRTVFDRQIQAASLDHSVWFHRNFRADDWLLYVQDSPNAGGARGLARGLIYARDGRLLASIAQEGLIRLRRPQ